MMEGVIASARAVGVEEPFHIWADKPVEGAITYDAGNFKKDHYLFKLDFLKEIGKLFYDYYVFIDADSWFVRHPGDLIRYCHDSPVHFTMESDCTLTHGYRQDWWNCPLSEYCRLMREKGVRSRSIYNLNAGFWITKRGVTDHVFRLGQEFWHHANKNEYVFTEEAPLAYVAHMLMGNPYKHQLRLSPELWASDWMGHFKDRIPVDEPWVFNDYMTGEPIPVQPAIVHAMRSKEAIINETRRLKEQVYNR